MNSHSRQGLQDAFQLDLSGTFIRRADLSGALLIGADFSGADCTNANFRGADFRGAILNGTILKGADLTDARNLTLQQIQSAVIDDKTRLPSGLR
jgi:uncharacterized protein YjbI with pentapeptide repeats